MLGRRLVAVLLLVVALPASAGRGDGVTGFVGRSSTEPAAGVTVSLVDPATDTVVATTTTNFFGKYAFRDLVPGAWQVRVEGITLDAAVSGGMFRLDLDLSAADGTMDYGRAAATAPPPAAGGAAVHGSVPPAATTGPNDPELMRQMAATYYQYSAGGLGYTGGTERTVTLCPDGRVFSSSDTSYSGGSHGSWATKGGGAATGTWRVVGTWQQGTLTTVANDGTPTEYRFERCGGDCIYMGNNKFAVAGAPSCP